MDTAEFSILQTVIQSKDGQRSKNLTD